MKIGIFFGGPAREREISFAGGRTVYDNLDKNLFEPIPLFVTAQKELILLDWKWIYKGSIRDFFPAADILPGYQGFQLFEESLELSSTDRGNMLERYGQIVDWTDLHEHIDFAFLALHGEFGEDGQIQGILDAMHIPYSGCGLTSSAICIDKGIQKRLMEAGGFSTPRVLSITLSEYKKRGSEYWYQNCLREIGEKMVIRPTRQGSSIGVSVLSEKPDLNEFEAAADKAFFILKLNSDDWHRKSELEKRSFLREINDLRSGLGFPVHVGGKIIRHPQVLAEFLDQTPSGTEIEIEAGQIGSEILVEEFLIGKEFSCITMRLDDGQLLALPPTEIIKGRELYDYRSKYLPGLSRKETPIHLPDQDILAIQKECKRLFEYLDCQVYARIDGFFTPSGDIFLNDPNTTSGMLPSSFFFHQAAEMGINPTQFLSMLIRISLIERLNQGMHRTKVTALIEKLDSQIHQNKTAAADKKKVGVILGGYSFERHISVESGRNIFEKLASSTKYIPIPLFLIGSDGEFELHHIPISLLLKDNADDIRDKILNFKEHELVRSQRDEHMNILGKYREAHAIDRPERVALEKLNQMVDLAFIALHGRPGEDGTIQQSLERLGIPYNGSGVQSSQTTIDKYLTGRQLTQKGFEITRQKIYQRADYRSGKGRFVEDMESEFEYPFIAKPVDDGCSSAVRLLDNRKELELYLECIFRDGALSSEQRGALNLGPRDEFPSKNRILVEAKVAKESSQNFMEITVGLLTHMKEGVREYEVFEPSEALAGEGILSLEEKFLAGEGQNITPARFGSTAEEYRRIAEKVKSDIRRAAEVLNVEGYARIDAFVRIFDDGHVETIILEVNSLPGMTPATCIFHQTAIAGYKPGEFIDRILEYAQQKKEMSHA